MCKVAGAKKVIIADVLEQRMAFATENQFADEKFLVPMKKCQTIEEKLAYAQEVAGLAKAASSVGEVDAVFECTGVESCLQAAIYASLHPDF